jgi:superfamily II helicase
MRKALSKEEIVKAAEWLKRKVELEKEMNEHTKLCMHWAVEQQPIYLNKDGSVNYERANICEFCGKSMSYFTHNDSPEYKYNKIQDLI